MKRWTTAEKELQGYKRRLANDNIKVSLSRPPWEKSSIELKTEDDINDMQGQSKNCRTRKGRAD